VIVIVIAFLTAYCALLVALHSGWQRAIRLGNNPPSPFYPFISVVIPFRNEQGNIQAILNDLRAQDYSNYEVILVNDHSTDESVSIAERHRFANVSIVENRQVGKKGALATGIALAHGEIIATTDCDCRVGPLWLESIRKTICDTKLNLVFGAVFIDPKSSVFETLQSVEFASLIGSGAATAGLGFPTMCNGANLAFRKEAFHTVGGYRGNEHIASGDDEFLLRKILATFPESVGFIPYKEAAVRTRPAKSLGSFFNQRLRWAGKWRHNSSAIAMGLAFFILLTQLAVFGAILSLINTINYSIIILILSKTFLEGALISRVCRFCKIRMSWGAFFLLQILYPLYVLSVGITSNFISPVWKGRVVKTEMRKH
jgi:poly-beta-1,6-N-acetyl-D-glucosamine synthase